MIYKQKRGEGDKVSSKTKDRLHLLQKRNDDDDNEYWFSFQDGKHYHNLSNFKSINN